MFALFESWNSGLLQRRFWLPNIVAGIIVGIVALPLAMAFAIASGATPEQGLYTAIIAGFCVSIFGGSQVQIAGPTGAFIVILAGITAQYGIEGLQIATLMAGAILIILGLLQMGSLIKFIPDPVITGFTAGIGIIIWIGQWNDFFGLTTPPNTVFHLQIVQLVHNLPHFHLPTTLLAVFSLLLVIYSPKIKILKHVPGPFVALVTATLLQTIFHWQGIKTIGSVFGEIPQGLPQFTLPNITVHKMLALFGPAFTIAMLGAIESLLSA